MTLKDPENIPCRRDGVMRVMLPNVLMPVLGGRSRKGLLSSSQFLVENILSSDRSLSPADDSGNESPPRPDRPSPELSDHDDKYWNGKKLCLTIEFQIETHRSNIPTRF